MSKYSETLVNDARDLLEECDKFHEINSYKMMFTSYQKELLLKIFEEMGINKKEISDG